MFDPSCATNNTRIRNNGIKRERVRVIERDVYVYGNKTHLEYGRTWFQPAAKTKVNLTVVRKTENKTKKGKITQEYFLNVRNLKYPYFLSIVWWKYRKVKKKQLWQHITKTNKQTKKQTQTNNHIFRIVVNYLPEDRDGRREKNSRIERPNKGETITSAAPWPSKIRNLIRRATHSTTKWKEGGRD